MLSNTPLIVNSVSSYRDVWPMFIGQIAKYYPNSKVYFFTDSDQGFYFPDNYTIIKYKSNNTYRDQFLQCIYKVPEQIAIYLAEDSVLYAPVDLKAINQFKTAIATSDISFIRFTRGDNFTDNVYIPSQPKLTQVDMDQPCGFTLLPCIWKVHDLAEVHQKGPKFHIARTGGPQFESEGTRICKELGYKGLQYYNDELKRGAAHYDNNIFPYIATAIVGGKWNTAEYYTELTPLLADYNINPTVRGFFV